MNKSRLVLILLRPSILSFSVSLAAALLILVLSNWSVLIRSPLFYDYFFGPAGLVTVMQDAPSGYSAFTEAIVAGPFTYNVLVLIVAAVVGLVVYGLLEGFDRLAASTSQTITDIQEANHPGDTQAVRAEVGMRLGVRVVSLVLWIVYGIAFGKVILPFAILAFRSGLGEPFTLAGTQYNLTGLFVLILGFHVHVILLRFLMLRLRIFGVHPELFA